MRAVRELLDCGSDKYYKARQYWSPLAWSDIVGSDKTLVTFMSFVHKCLNPSEVELWTLPGLNKAFSVVEVNKKDINRSSIHLNDTTTTGVMTGFCLRPGSLLERIYKTYSPDWVHLIA